jgi:hypothetical protein
MFRKVFFALIFGICVLVQAQTVAQQPTPSVTDSVSKTTVRDTMSAPVLSVADTTRKPVDTAVTPSTASLVIDTIKSPTLAVSKKKYNHREQIVFATIMMLFIAVVISSAQNWNPD